MTYEKMYKKQSTTIKISESIIHEKVASWQLLEKKYLTLIYFPYLCVLHNLKPHTTDKKHCGSPYNTVNAITFE